MNPAPWIIPDPHRHWGCRLNDEITLHGIEALLIQNELIQVMILVGQGGEIVQFLHKPTDTDFLWRGPNRLHRAAHFPTNGSAHPAPFLDQWSGGWFEAMPNGGPACEYKGAPLGFFGETVLVPWQYRVLEDTPQRVQVAMWIHAYRTPFLLGVPSPSNRANPASFLKNA
jgi:hypothetical protein